MTSGQATVDTWPKVLVTSVIRSAHQGESHGGVYLVDFNESSFEQLLEWSRSGIDWSGRGGDRGLRGIAFFGDSILIAASDELFVFDRDMRVTGSIRNRYLKHCHEIAIVNKTLFVTATGYDAILAYDLSADRFVRGYCVRYEGLTGKLARLRMRMVPRLSVFDPNSAVGPTPGDTTHVNHVWPTGDRLYVAGTRLGYLLEMDGAGSEQRRIPLPFGTHNSRPWRNGVIANCTRQNAVCVLDRQGRVLKRFELPEYPKSEITFADLPRDHARQGFGRGLAMWTRGNGTYVIAGSSPATVSLFSVESEELLASVQLTKDVRNAVHGLEIWPF